MKRKRRTHILILVLCLALLCACTAQQAAAGPSAAPQAPDASVQTADRSSHNSAVSPAASKPDYTEAYLAYLGVLENSREDILNYNWQKGLVFDEDRYESVPEGDSESIAVADIWGDDTPELIYISAPRTEEDSVPMDAELHIVTYLDGKIRELYQEYGYDTMAGGGMYYRLFQTASDKGLWINTLFYLGFESDEYTQFSADGSSGELTPEHEYRYSCYLSYNDNDDMEEFEEWEIDNAACSQDEFESAIPSESAQLSGLLLYNTDYGDEGSALSEGAAMTCDEAVAFLREKAGVTVDLSVNETAFFSSLPDFWFASGAGGWETTLSIEPDGSFYGSFYDSDMGSIGEGYPNGTVYVCSFSGRFGNVVRQDEYTCVMDTLELIIEPTEADEWIEDGVLYVASGPYGMEDAEKVYVYLPGSQMSRLPWPFVSWVSAPHVWGAATRPSILPFYGLYNENAGTGFSGDE